MGWGGCGDHLGGCKYTPPPGSAVNAPEGGPSMGGPMGVSNLSRALFGTTLSDPSHLRLYEHVDVIVVSNAGGFKHFEMSLVGNLKAEVGPKGVSWGSLASIGPALSRR